MQTISTNGKVCSTCRESKPLDAFGNYKKSPDGKRWQCKQCRNGAANGHQCPACDFRGRNIRAVATHWAHVHDGPCPLTTTAKQCAHCGGSFNVSNAALAVRPHDYCSRDCWKAAVAVEATAQCDHCGSAYKTRDSHAAATRKYCSKACADAAAVGRVVTRQTVQCEHCGAPFQEIAYRLDRGRRYCSHECASRAKDEGKTSLEERFRSAEKARGWRTAVLERDNYTCRECGVSHPPGSDASMLHAHHVVPVPEIVADLQDPTEIPSHRLFAEVSNGMTLCAACHFAAHGKEKRGQPE